MFCFHYWYFFHFDKLFICNNILTSISRMDDIILHMKSQIQLFFIVEILRNPRIWMWRFDNKDKVWENFNENLTIFFMMVRVTWRYYYIQEQSFTRERISLSRKNSARIVVWWRNVACYCYHRAFIVSESFSYIERKDIVDMNRTISV